MFSVDKFIFVTSLRVRYAETDQMGVVNHANYLSWFEVCRSELCRQRGISYGDWEKRGYYIPVAECSCRYKQPALYDDVIQLWCSAENINPYSLTFRYRVIREADGVLLAEGRTKHAIVGADGKLLGKNNAFYLRLLEEKEKIDKEKTTEDDKQ